MFASFTNRWKRASKDATGQVLENPASCILRQVRFKRYSRCSRARGDTRTLRSPPLTDLSLTTLSPVLACVGANIFAVVPLPLRPPRVHLTSHTWWMRPGLPHFSCSSASVYYTERKPKNKKRGRPGMCLPTTDGELVEPFLLCTLHITECKKHMLNLLLHDLHELMQCYWSGGLYLQLFLTYMYWGKVIIWRDCNYNNNNNKCYYSDMCIQSTQPTPHGL